MVGQVAALAISSKAKKGYQSKTLHQHQSSCRLLVQGLGLTEFPGAAKKAPQMDEFFWSLGHCFRGWAISVPHEQVTLSLLRGWAALAMTTAQVAAF
jgi:hypothetical protein